MDWTEFVKVLFAIGFPALVFWYGAFCPLPEERDLPKEQRTRSIAQCYWDTFKK